MCRLVVSPLASRKEGYKNSLKLIQGLNLKYKLALTIPLPMQSFTKTDLIRSVAIEILSFRPKKTNYFI